MTSEFPIRLVSRPRRLLVLVLVCFALPTAAIAKSKVGTTAQALPGLARLQLAEPLSGKAALAVDLGYRYLEPFEQDSSGHHGAGASLAGSLQVAPWLLVAGMLQGEAMSHPADALGKDRSASGLPSFSARVFQQADALAFGAQLELRLPGQDAPSIEPAATSVDLVGLLSYRASGSPLTIALNAGYRLDRSAKAAPAINSLRQGDRLALGASDYDALLARLGAAYQLDKTTLFTELSSDFLYGARPRSISPGRVTLGIRHQVGPAVTLQTLSQVGVSKRPSLPDTAKHIPIEPRFVISFGIRVALAQPTPAPKLKPRPIIRRPARGPPAAVKKKVVVLRELKGLVTDASGSALPQVTLTLTIGAWQEQTQSNMAGAYYFRGVPAGQATLKAETVDYDSVTQQLQITGQEASLTGPTFTLKLQALGAQLQGLVRTFKGAPLQASITLAPGGETHTTDAEGRFTIDVAPGKYQLTIRAAGYTPQNHSVTVSKEAVVVVNADLRSR